MKKIYVFCLPSSFGSDVAGFAVDKLIEEDGDTKLNAIASHISSGEYYCKHDMGITSDWKHDLYNEKYPEGYELVWLGYFNDDQEAYNVVVEKINNND